MKITLCGSARFEKAYHVWNKKLTLRGHVVYGLSTYPSIEGGNKDWHNNSDSKVLLDLVHLAKIDGSDAILVLNEGGYIGDSTKKEIMWACIKDRDIYALNTESVEELFRTAFGRIVGVMSSECLL